MSKPLKDECCEKFLRKDRACKNCPVMAPLGKKERKRLIAARRAAQVFALLGNPALLEVLVARRRREKKSHLDTLLE